MKARGFSTVFLFWGFFFACLFDFVNVVVIVLLNRLLQKTERKTERVGVEREKEKILTVTFVD